MKEIKILQGQGRGPMRDDVNKHIQEGWTLVGPVQFAVNLADVNFQKGIVHYMATLERDIVDDSSE